MLDIRSLAAFRILFGLYLLYDTYSRFSLGRYDLLWYTEDGFLAPSERPHRSPLHLLWFYRGSLFFQIICVAVSMLLSLLFALGWDRPVAKIALFVVHTAEQSRNMPAHDGSDSFVRHLLLWSCFLPLARVWSLDAWSKSHHTNKALFPTASVSGLPCLALLLQIVFMYLGTVLLRIETMGWDSEWVYPQLSAVHYALSGSFAARDNFMTQYVRQSPQVSKCMTASAMIIEGVFPILSFLFGNQRHLFALQLFLLHLGLILMVNLINWQLVGMLTQVLWIPTHAWDAWLGSMGNSVIITTAIHKKTDGETVMVQRTTASPNDIVFPPEPLKTSNKFSRSIQVFFFTYMIYNWMGNRQWIAKHDHGDIGEGLRLSQYWVMYRTLGRTAHNVFLTGYAQKQEYEETFASIHDSPSVVNLLHYVKTGQWKIQDPPELVISNMTDRFPSPRWERTLSQWTSDGTKKQAIRHFCAKLCMLVNEDRQSQQLPPLSDIEFSWLDIGLMPPGSKTRYAKATRRHSVSLSCNHEIS